MKRVAVIPARIGSKRVPQKNIRQFGGAPMISYTINVALESGLFDRVIVSTDHPKVADVAESYGAEAPFLRPPALSDDHTGTNPVVAHALEWLMKTSGQTYDIACCLYATAPFMRVQDIQSGMKLLLSDPDRQFVFSATRYRMPIQRAIRRLPDGGVEPMDIKSISMRTQDLEPSYHDAGQFYWGTADAFLNGLPLFAPHSAMVEIPSHLVHDIDEESDWVAAEIQLNTLRRCS